MVQRQIITRARRPLFHFDLLPQIEANPDKYTDLAQPWVRQQHPADAKEPWLALSRQWNRWKEFCAWRLRGRRRRPAFEEYLDAQGREFLMGAGISKCAAQPDFERSARLSWEREYDYEDKEDVETHAGCVSRWLVHQGFVLGRPFQLLADPKRQDQWTRYVEYLAFEAELFYVLAEVARKLERTVKIRGGYEGKYRAAKAALDQQRCRVDWVLSEIEMIEEEKALGADESGGGNNGRIRKRRRTDKTSPAPENVVEPQLGKRRQMDQVEETEKTSAGKRDNLSQTRRSKRRKSSVEEEEEDETNKDSLEPQSKMVSTNDDPSNSTSDTAPSRQRRRHKRITTPRGTAATAPPDHCGERLKSLRRRVNGIAVLGLMNLREYKGARRSGGCLRASAQSTP